MSKIEIKGYTAEEVAESEKKKLEADYEFCCSRQKEIKKHEIEIQQLQTEWYERIMKYRMNSVDRVLAYIRFKKITDPQRLDLLLCHCQNKLHGNIDGTELTLEEDER